MIRFSPFVQRHPSLHEKCAELCSEISAHDIDQANAKSLLKKTKKINKSLDKALNAIKKTISQLSNFKISDR